ncbi:LPXTG cell wall anchor domain-containing protein [Burkholderia cenocepacia]
MPSTGADGGPLPALLALAGLLAAAGALLAARAHRTRRA